MPVVRLTVESARARLRSHRNDDLPNTSRFVSRDERSPIARPHNRHKLPLGLFRAGAWVRSAPELGFVWRWSPARTIGTNCHWVCFAPELGFVSRPSLASFGGNRPPAQSAQIAVGFVWRPGVASFGAGAWFRLAPIGRPHNRSKLPLGLFRGGAWVRSVPVVRLAGEWAVAVVRARLR
jgi:hypothetical protein